MPIKSQGLVAFNRSIRARLVIGTFTILLALIVVLTTLIARNASLLLKEQTDNQLNLVVNQSARAFGDFLEARVATIDLWASDSLLLSVVRDPALSAVFLPSLSSYLGRYTVQEPWISNIFLINNAQFQFALKGSLNTIDFEASELLDSERFSDYVGVLKSSKSLGNTRLIIVRQAIDRGNAMDGIYVAMQLDLDVVHQHLFSDVRPSENGFMTILSANGSLAVSDIPETLAQRLPNDADQQTSNVLTALPESHFLIREAAVEGTQLRLLGAAVTSDIEKPVRQMVYIATAFGLFAIVLGILGTVYFANHVTAPLRQLSSEARELAQYGIGTHNSALVATGHKRGHRTANKDSNKHYGADEVGELAAIFDLLNRTTSDLTNANSQLEKKNLDLDSARSSLSENLGRLERELDSARQLQLGMVPSPNSVATQRLPIDLAALMQPAREVGGDFYDFFPIGTDSLCIVIGDVSDKGTPSALFMARTITLIRFAFEKMGQMENHKWEPADVMRQVNIHLCEYNSTRMFVTLFVGLVNTKSGSVVYTNCGHISPIVISNRTGRPLTKGKPDLPLGVRKTASYRNSTFHLKPRDYLLLYTDGVTEAENRNRLFFGREKLVTTLESQDFDSSESIVHATRKAVEEFANGAEPFDDITMLALGWRPIVTEHNTGETTGDS